MHYSRFIRLLHTITAVAIIFHLMISFIMDHPHASKPMTINGALYFQWHEWIGLAALTILMGGWIYRLMNWKRESQDRFFPWFKSSRRLSITHETGHLLIMRWTKIPENGALAGTIHELGLLIASVMVLTGGVIYVALGSQNTVTPGVHNLMEVYLFLATFICGLLIWTCAHGVMPPVHGAPGSHTNFQVVSDASLMHLRFSH